MTYVQMPKRIRGHQVETGSEKTSSRASSDYGELVDRIPPDRTSRHSPPPLVERKGVHWKSHIGAQQDSTSQNMYIMARVRYQLRMIQLRHRVTVNVVAIAAGEINLCRHRLQEMAIPNHRKKCLKHSRQLRSYVNFRAGENQVKSEKSHSACTRRLVLFKGSSPMLIPQKPQKTVKNYDLFRSLIK